MSDCTEALQPPTCLKPYGVTLPPLSLPPSVRADHIPHQGFLVPSVLVSVFICPGSFICVLFVYSLIY